MAARADIVDLADIMRFRRRVSKKESSKDPELRNQREKDLDCDEKSESINHTLKNDETGTRRLGLAFVASRTVSNSLVIQKSVLNDGTLIGGIQPYHPWAIVHLFVTYSLANRK